VTTVSATDVRRVFLAAADAATALLADPRVAARWGGPSGCDGWRVGGVAAHLARAVTDVEHQLALAVGEDGPRARPADVTAGAYLAALPGLDDPASELSVAVRERSAATAAAAGAAGVLAQARSALAALRVRLPAEPADRVVAPMDLPMSLDEYLRTCLAEICVRAEDLALSLDVDLRRFPDDVVRGAVAVLVDTAVHRNGPAPAIRTHASWDRADALAPL
jgi:stage V sporulation protein SpoVS